MDASSPSSRLRLLVAASDRQVACDLRSTLERLGHVVSGPWPAGGAALTAAARRRPDVALIDLRLGGEPDAVALATRLREQGGVPVIFVIGQTSGPLLDRAMAARPAGYLKRPHSDAELAACLAAARDDRVLAAEATAPATPVSEAEPIPEPMARGLALAKAAELSRRPSFRELLGRRGATQDSGASFLEEVDGEETPFDAESDSDDSADDPVSLLDLIGDPVLLIDGEGRVAEANARALVDFGGASPLIGREFWSGFEGEERGRGESEFSKALRSPTGAYHFGWMDTARHRYYEISAYRTPSPAPGGEPGLLVWFRDVSTRRRTEAESLRQQRLEGLGLLARGFAHDFNNLLTILIGSLDLAAESLPDGSFEAVELDNARGAAGDASDLVQQLLTFAQGGEPIREPIRICDLVRAILGERRRTRPGIRYQFQSSEVGLPASVDPRQISRLIENLVTNAEQAMPDGGVLIARCQRLPGAEVGRFRNTGEVFDEEFAIIEIIDTGRGMSEAELEQAFEPFFTTRGGANATGIGLTVCESIAKAHGGFVMLQSKEGRGTIATLCLPLREPVAALSPAAGTTGGFLPTNVFMPRLATESGPADAGEIAKVSPLEPASDSREDLPAETVASDGGRILILEDDELIRRLIAVTLRRDGHEVVETADGHETIAAYRQAMEEDRPFDLVLSDLTIVHGLGGVETIRALRDMDPGVVAIVSSGYSDAPAMARPEAFGFSAVLPKPYPPRELRSLIADMLRRCRRARGELFPG